MIRDVIRYCEVFQRCSMPRLDAVFQKLKEYCNLLIVKPEHLKNMILEVAG